MEINYLLLIFWKINYIFIVHISFTLFLWYLQVNTQFILERKTENSAGTCSYYFSSSTVESYDNAVRQCDLRRAVLAKFKSSAELRFARTTINTIYPSTTNNYYVGTTREMNNQWLWTDGDSVLPSKLLLISVLQYILIICFIIYKK